MYLKSLIPTLLDKTNLDLETTLEFSRYYHIEDSYPSILYVQKLLLGTMNQPRDLHYQNQIAGVLEDVHEHEVSFCKCMTFLE